MVESMTCNISCITFKVVYIEEAVNSRRCAGHLKAYDKVSWKSCFSHYQSRIVYDKRSKDKCMYDCMINMILFTGMSLSF